MYEIITTEQGVRDAASYLSSQPVVSVDSETTDLTPRTGRIRLLQCATPEKTYIFDCFAFDNSNALKPLAPVFSNPKPRKVFHHAKFDIKFIKKELGIDVEGIYDTMLASQMLSAGYIDHKHGLGVVASRYLKEDVDKEEQKSNWSGALSKEQFDYAARDAEILLPLRIEQSKRLRDQGLIKTAMIEFGSIQALANVEMNGFPVHLDMYREIVKGFYEELDRVAAPLRELLGVNKNQGDLFAPSDEKEINLGSWQQIKAGFARIGIDMPEGTGAPAVKKLIHEHPELALLSEYRVIEKKVNAYGNSFIDLIDKTTWRVYPDFRQLGTKTGRCSCKDPNIQQVPRKKECRACFRPKPGSNRCLIIADYSQLELRILAHLSGDENMLAGFRSGHDYHTAAALQLGLAKTIAEVTSELRTFAKTVNFAVTYGMGPPSLAATLSAALGYVVTIKEAEKFLGNYFRTYRGMRAYLDATVKEGMAARKVRTGAGRIIHLVYDPDNDGSRSHAQREAMNAPIQGATGDILKTVLPDLERHLQGSSAQIVNLIHDEIVLECDIDEAETVKAITEARMIAGAQEYIYEVPVEVSTVIAESWAEK